MNEAFEKHDKKSLYTRSRGQLLLESFKYENIYDFLDLYDLRDIEPFTLILIEMEEVPKLIEFIWDSNMLYIRELEHNISYIWSSPTLYKKHVRMQREQWFSEWLERESKFDRESILKFHSSSHGNDRGNDVIMKRDHGPETVSITQVAFGSDNFSMYYHDLLLNKMTSLTNGLKKIAIY